MKLKDLLIMQKNEDKIAVFYKEQGYSYKLIYQKVNKIISNFRTIDCNNIGLFIENSIEYVIGYFAITFLDKVIVPIESTAKKDTILSTIKYCELNIILTNDTNFNTLRDYLKNDIKTEVLIYNISNGLSEVISKGSKLDVVIDKDESENKTAIMLHTSGTTSDPKKVMLTHKNLVSNIKSNICSLQLTKEDCCLIVLPMCFGYSNTSQFLTHFYLGAQIVIMDSIFIPHKFFYYLDKYKCTNTTCIPSMLYLIVKSKKDKMNIPTLKYLCFGGGTIAKEVLKGISDILPNVGIVQTYGQTEASPRVTCLLPEDSVRKRGSVGKPIPGVEVKIFNEDCKEVLPNEKGEIVVRGNNVMKGYYKKPEETQKVIKDGWLHTGDIGLIDEDGFLYVVGRIKNIIISGGLNIYPEEIEETLRSFEDIKEAIVLPKFHEMLAEVPIAKVVLKENSSVTEKDILKFCKSKLDIHKVPSEIIIVNEIEKTYNGKIRRI